MFLVSFIVLVFRLAEERAKTEFLLSLHTAPSFACFALFKVIIKSRLRFAIFFPLLAHH
jgi:hypothetical protein